MESHNRLSNMESDQTPRLALEQAAVARAALADRARAPRWYHPALGLLVGGLVAAQAAPTAVSLAFLSIFCVGLVFLTQAYQRHTGMWISGMRKGRTRWVALATAALTAAVPSLAATSAGISGRAGAAPESAMPQYALSVMLWTVFNDMPFEERLAKVAESGYNKVQLVGEYHDWKQADFDRANAAAKRLGIQFDATAGLHNGVANPAVRRYFPFHE